MPKSEKALSNLLARPEHISSRLISQEESWADKQDDRFSLPTTDTGIAAPVIRQSYFQWLNAIYVNPKDVASRLEPIPINIYAHHLPQGFICFSGYWLDGSSVAKVEMRLESGKDDVKSHVEISSLNGGEKYRLGSVFVQLAIEYSIQNGCDGRVTLRSTRNSGQFYFKLGFAPSSDDVYEALLEGQEVNGWDMYLPDACIAVWRQKIEKKPLLIREIKPQLLENMHIHSDETIKLWPLLIDKLYFNAIRALSFDYAYQPRISHQSLLQAFKENTSLESLSLKGSTFQYPLSEVIDALSSHTHLSYLTLRNYDECTKEIDDAAFQSLAHFIAHTRLRCLTLAHLKLHSKSFEFFCNALASTVSIKKIVFDNITLSPGNIDALKRALLTNTSIIEIISLQCEHGFEMMLAEVREQKNSRQKITGTSQTFFAGPSLASFQATEDQDILPTIPHALGRESPAI